MPTLLLSGSHFRYRSAPGCLLGSLRSGTFGSMSPATRPVGFPRGLGCFRKLCQAILGANAVPAQLGKGLGGTVLRHRGSPRPALPGRRDDPTNQTEPPGRSRSQAGNSFRPGEWRWHPTVRVGRRVRLLQVASSICCPVSLRAIDCPCGSLPARLTCRPYHSTLRDVADSARRLSTRGTGAHITLLSTQPTPFRPRHT